MKESDIRNPSTHERYLELVRQDANAFFTDPNLLEETPCPACGDAAFNREFVKFGFQYGTCSGCRTLYVNPRPKLNSLMEFYVDSISSRYWVEEFFLPMAEARRERMFRPRAEYVSRRMERYATGLIGDIGAGFGLFLEELRKLWPTGDFVAIEPSPEMAQICRGKGLRVEQKGIEELAGYEGKFSLLTSFELLEHLHTPRAMVEQAFRLLKPGGCFIASTLSGEGFDIQVLWEKSRSVFPPHHLNFLNPESLARLCREVGFEVEVVETPGVLDWSILEGAIERQEIVPERFWRLLRQRGSGEAKQEFQSWLTKWGFSSHMRVVALKPRSR